MLRYVCWVLLSYCARLFLPPFSYTSLQHLHISETFYVFFFQTEFIGRAKLYERLCISLFFNFFFFFFFIYSLLFIDAPISPVLLKYSRWGTFVTEPKSEKRKRKQEDRVRKKRERERERKWAKSMRECNEMKYSWVNGMQKRKIWKMQRQMWKLGKCFALSLSLSLWVSVHEIAKWTNMIRERANASFIFLLIYFFYLLQDFLHKFTQHIRNNAG